MASPRRSNLMSVSASSDSPVEHAGQSPDLEHSVGVDVFGGREHASGVIMCGGERGSCHGGMGDCERPREPLGCGSSSPDVPLGARPLTLERQDLCGTGVRPSQVQRPVGILCERRRQLRTRIGSVPVAIAKMRVAQVCQAMDRIRGWQACTYSGRRNAQVSDALSKVVE